jgi:ABC-2 type transport system ATP-binding protein
MIEAITVKDLRKIYHNNKAPHPVEALRGISLSVAEGDFFALLGPNGAGKTTLISILTSLVNKTSGTAEIFGTSITEDPSLAKTYIGVVPQEFNFNIFEKVIDIITAQAGYYGIPRVQALADAEPILKNLGLWEKRNEVSQSLSGGMKRRLMIARALIHKPRLLILDEPTAGVDVEMRHSMWEFLTTLNKNGTTIVLTTHYLEEAEQLCRNVAIINHGMVVLNESMQNLLERHGKEKLENVYLTLIKSDEQQL